MSADLDAIKARWAAATPGPWWYDPTKVNSVDRGEAVFAGKHRGLRAITVASTGPADDPQSMADAEAIARAPEDIAALIQALEEVRDALTVPTDDNYLRVQIARNALEQHMGADWLNGGAS